MVRNIERKRAANQAMGDDLAAHVAIELDMQPSYRPTYHARNILQVPTWLVSEKEAA